MSLMGTRVLRKEDPAFLTSGATYTADLTDPRLAGAAHVTFVRSHEAHARVQQIHVDDAKELPGVLAVLTAADVGDLAVLPPAVPLFPEPMLAKPYLASDVVRYVGDPIAVIVSETREAGADAAELVWAETEPLEPVVDITAAESDTDLLFPEVGTNTAVDLAAIGMSTGVTDDSFFADCEVVVRQEMVNQRVAPCPLEGRSAAATWDDGRLVLWLSNQTPHGVKTALASVYELEPEQVLVISPDVGGGFGAKIGAYPEEVLLPWISRQLDRPVRWVETRSESMLGLGHGRAQLQRIALGGDRQGKLSAYRLEVVGDAGAYASMGGVLPFMTHVMAPGVYDLPNVETGAKSVVTNTTTTVAYRGAGRPEATAALERAVDLYAAEIGLDPVELRRRNLLAPEQMPHTTAVGTEYDTGDYGAALDRALEAAGYTELRAEQARRREAGDRSLLGIGIAVYVEVTAGPAPGGNEFAKVEITADGKARVYSGAFSHGHSHATTFAMLVADEFGLDLADVEVIQGDTDLVAQGTGTFGSRSLQIGGSAVQDAAGQVADKAKEIAAGLLEANVDDVVLDAGAGAFHVAGTPAVSKSWADVAAAAEGALSAESDFHAGASYPFGAHVAVVSVDADTGAVAVERVVTCDDSGTLINPLIVEGQRHGGIAQGVAQALMEEVRFDSNGVPQTSNFADYAIISAPELPSFELVPMETPTPQNPLGAKGIGESGAIGSTPAVQNAVVDAVSHLGVRHIDMPCTAEKVWQAMRAATG